MTQQQDTMGRNIAEHPKVGYGFEYVEGRVLPRNDNVLLRWEELPDTSPSGLIALPRADYARAIDGRAAVVVAVGPGPSYAAKCDGCGKPRYPFRMGVTVGDRVIVDGRQIGEVVYVEGIEHRLVREAEILAVVE